MAIRRENYESKAIKPFADVLNERQLDWFSGQKADNRIALERNVSYQFGDLRFSRDSLHLIVEVESAGGVTNLAKYWYCLQEGLVSGSVRLFHVFWQDTPDSYRSHLLVWDLLRERMEAELSGVFKAWRCSYHPDSLSSDLAQAVEDFAALLPDE